MSKVLVIGGGASGMIAAGTAAKNGHEVHLFEKNSMLGKKLYITGKGRCNLTNCGEIQDFIDNTPSNPFFLYSALYNFSNLDVIEFFKRLGVETKVERGGRVFPVSDKSQDIVDALKRFLNKYKVNVHLNHIVDKLIIEDNKVIGILTNNGKQFYYDSIIIATGGLSYPATGSTGDGYKFAKQLGHKVTNLYPSLVPLIVDEDYCNDLQGLTLKNIEISIYNNNKIIYNKFGELLFTHYGVSGPVILSASRNIAKLEGTKLVLSIDLKPALDEKMLDNRILKDFDKNKNKDFKNSLDELLPKKIIPIIILLSKINPYKKVNEITKDERRKLVSTIKALTFHINGTRGYKEAVITMGGVAVSEVEPSTMKSKIFPNVLFAGELLDVDAYTGGYNLQIAFSTGYMAGMSV